MADYRKLAIDLVATNGIVSDNEIRMIKKNIYADGKINDAEISFLLDIRTAALRKVKDATMPEFDKFFLKALEDNILNDGQITVDEVTVIKKYVVNSKIDTAEVKKFLDKLKKKATTKVPEFDKLVEAFEKKLAAA